MTAPAK